MKFTIETVPVKPHTSSVQVSESTINSDLGRQMVFVDPQQTISPVLPIGKFPNAPKDFYWLWGDGEIILWGDDQEILL